MFDRIRIEKGWVVKCDGGASLEDFVGEKRCGSHFREVTRVLIFLKASHAAQTMVVKVQDQFSAGD